MNARHTHDHAEMIGVAQSKQGKELEQSAQSVDLARLRRAIYASVRAISDQQYNPESILGEGMMKRLWRRIGQGYHRSKPIPHRVELAFARVFDLVQRSLDISDDMLRSNRVHITRRIGKKIELKYSHYPKSRFPETLTLNVEAPCSSAPEYLELLGAFEIIVSRGTSSFPFGRRQYKLSREVEISAHHYNEVRSLYHHVEYKYTTANGEISSTECTLLETLVTDICQVIVTVEDILASSDDAASVGFLELEE